MLLYGSDIFVIIKRIDLSYKLEDDKITQYKNIKQSSQELYN